MRGRFTRRALLQFAAAAGIGRSALAGEADAVSEGPAGLEDGGRYERAAG